MQERRAYKRIRGIAVRVAVLLVLGAVMNVAVAWGCSLWSRAGLTVTEHTFGDHSDVELYMHTHRLNVAVQPGLWAWRTATMAGVSWYQAHHWSESYQDDPDLWLHVQRVGWPMRCFQCVGSTPWPPTRAFGFVKMEWDTALGGPLGVKWSATSDSTMPPLPYGPVLTGMVFNTIFFAGMLWLLFAFPFTVRRWRRIRRGLRAKFASPIGANVA